MIWLKDGSTQCVDDIEIVKLLEGEYVAVYNFEVADFHTYFVFDYDVLVRNKCKYDTPKVPVEHIGDTKQGKHFHTGMPKGEDMDKKIIFNKKAKNNMRLKLDEFSSFKFEYYFEDKELISTVMKIYEYDTPVFSSIEFGFDNVVYKKWMYNIFFSLNFLNEVALLVEQFDLWCVVNINSYSDFSEEMINLNKDFTIIDIEQDIAIDFSSGETNYEIRVLEPVHIKLLQFDNKYVIINT